MEQIRKIVREILFKEGEEPFWWERNKWGRDLPGPDPFSPGALGGEYMPENSEKGSTKLKLTEPQTKFLMTLPEQGTGYQIVDIKLKNGNILKKKIVVNSEYVQLDIGESLKANEIESMTLSK